MVFHAALLLLCTLGLYYAGALYLLSLPAGFSFLLLLGLNWQAEQNACFLFHPANLVTFLRLALLFIIGLNFSQFPPLLVGLIALAILLMDGLDGYLARKYQTSSLFGEYLDMETDALYVLVMTCILYQMDYLGLWILALGLLRYVYFLVLKNVKSPEQKEARVFRARLIAVIFMASLSACLILPEFIYEPAVVIASALVVFSFGESFREAVFQN